MTIRGSSSTMRIDRPSREGRCIRFSSGAAKRKLPEAGRSRYLDRGCPEVSINPHTATKRDDRLGRQSPCSWGGLGAAWCLLTSYNLKGSTHYRLAPQGAAESAYAIGTMYGFIQLDWTGPLRGRRLNAIPGTRNAGVGG